MHIISEDDPEFGTPQGIREAAMQKAEAALAKVTSALAALEATFAEYRGEQDGAAFAKYVGAFESLGRPPFLTRDEFIAQRRADEARAEVAESYDDLEHRLPEKQRTKFGKLRT